MNRYRTYAEAQAKKRKDIAALRTTRRICPGICRGPSVLVCGNNAPPTRHDT